MVNFFSMLNLGFLVDNSHSGSMQSSLFSPSESIYTGFLSSSDTSCATDLVGYGMDSSWFNTSTDINTLLNTPPPIVSDSLNQNTNMTDLLNNKPDIVEEAYNYGYF